MRGIAITFMVLTPIVLGVFLLRESMQMWLNWRERSGRGQQSSTD